MKPAPAQPEPNRPGHGQLQRARSDSGARAGGTSSAAHAPPPPTPPPPAPPEEVGAGARRDSKTQLRRRTVLPLLCVEEPFRVRVGLWYWYVYHTDTCLHRRLWRAAAARRPPVAALRSNTAAHGAALLCPQKGLQDEVTVYFGCFSANLPTACATVRWWRRACPLAGGLVTKLLRHKGRPDVMHASTLFDSPMEGLA